MATIKFWQEMQRVVKIDGQDKLMIGKNSTGEAMYVNMEDINQFLSIVGTAVKPIPGGATEATAVVLQPNAAGQNREMNNVTGWFKNPTGAAWEAPVNSINTNWWDGTTWSLGSSVPIPSNPAEGTITEGDTKAVSGNTVFEAISNKDKELYFENGIFNSQSGNIITPNNSYDIYRCKVNKDNELAISSYFGNNAGTIFGYIAFSLDGRTINSWLYNSSSAITYETKNVIAPQDGYILINVRKGGSLPFKVYYLNDVLLYNSSIINDVNTRNIKKPASSALTYDINSKINIFDIKSSDITTKSATNANLAAAYKFASFNNKVFNNKKISKVIVNVNTAGTFSVMKIKNRGTSSVEVVDKEVFNVIAGENTLTLTKNLVIDNNTDFAVLDLTDTATIKYRTGSGPNPQGGDINVLFTTSGNWSVLPNDLNIAVTAMESSVINDIYSKFSNNIKGLVISVLGDSVSTFQGYIPAGNNNYYPRASDPQITRYEQTWWGKMLYNDGVVLNINNSSSGSIVAKSGGALSFYNRVTNIGINSDIIFLFGGTNDWLNAVPIGNTDLKQPIDDSTFIGCYRYVVEYILSNHVKSRLLVMVPMQRRKSTDEFPSLNSAGVAIQEYIKAVISICEWYGIDYIRTDFIQTNFNWSEYTNEGTHPNLKGMDIIYKYVINKVNKYK